MNHLNCNCKNSLEYQMRFFSYSNIWYKTIYWKTPITLKNKSLSLIRSKVRKTVFIPMIGLGIHYFMKVDIPIPISLIQMAIHIILLLLFEKEEIEYHLCCFMYLGRTSRAILTGNLIKVIYVFTQQSFLYLMHSIWIIIHFNGAYITILYYFQNCMVFLLINKISVYTFWIILE